jgi:hypothetical protein
VPDTEPTAVVERLRALADDLTTDDTWRTLLPRARARRRRRSMAGIAAGAAVVAIAAGGVAVARPGGSRDTLPTPAATPTPWPSGVDPWTDPVKPGPDAGHEAPGVAAYRGGVRLALLRDDIGTYAITAGVDNGKICTRIGGATPPGSRPVLVSAGCADDGQRPLWVPTSGSVAGLQTAFVVATPEATQLIWRRDVSGVNVELHDLPGSGRKVALVVGPDLAGSTLVAVAGARTLATYEFGTPSASDGPEQAMPTSADAVVLFTFGSETMWAQRKKDATVLFVGTNPGMLKPSSTFGSVPVVPARPVQEVSLDRVYLGERWVCGTARPDVTAVAYRLADGRTVRAALHEIPAGGRVWCVQLPHERLDQPPAKSDKIVATLSNGSTYEVAPKY